MLSASQTEIFNKSMTQIGAMMGARPILYGPDDRPVASYQYSRVSAKRSGSLKNWVPRRLLTREQEALEREATAERAIDLVNNEPNAAGALETFPMTAIGSGLRPHPAIDYELIGMEKDAARAVQKKQKNVHAKWSPHADASGKMSAGEIQWLLLRNLIQFGEFLFLLPMIDDDPLRPYSLAVQMVNPLRLKTPTDKINDGNIKDGLQIGKYGRVEGYWIKKAKEKTYGIWADNSENFAYVPAKRGHRWNCIHGFISKDPEQIRGISAFSPSMKLFRDFGDYLDAELVSNIVTAAYAMFIETEPQGDATDLARFMAARTETGINPDGDEQETRYEEMIPGKIMYGGSGQRPHVISAQRPGVVFEPFTKVLKKAISMGMGLPYPVQFKDTENVNFAGFRSAMLDAWRTFMFYRTYIGRDTWSRVYGMLQEEAYLNGEYDVPDFYRNYHTVTAADWIGPPKGDIEPVKDATADVIQINNHLKTRERAIAERSGAEYVAVFDQLEEEEDLIEDKDLNRAVASTPVDSDIENEGKEEDSKDED
jgi:lambda family phage portal protein